MAQVAAGCPRFSAGDSFPGRGPCPTPPAELARGANERRAEMMQGQSVECTRCLSVRHISAVIRQQGRARRKERVAAGDDAAWLVGAAGQQ